MQVAIVDSGGANITSIKYAFKRLGVKAELAAEHDKILAADRVVLPGVGSAITAMRQLKRYRLEELIKGLQQPVIGICLGMQLLYEFLDESNIAGLGIMAGTVKHFPAKAGLTLPHMGWNKVSEKLTNPLLSGVDGKYCYFVHSFAAPINDATIAATWHGIEFTSVCQRDNFFGIQCHPERSGTVGSKLLQNFLELKL